ncbi:hypothetical protein [Phenylobacterium sp.]|uniref:hypothetical protein n=1 Tax=Phenylobacterium sp. TaxID=1871053 RepID=UPI002727B6D2|nr:hypothetical protein [Phenylobacterium sp.]MDO8380643.1 hypothetical protein [Phenylobacterium sp.]
MTTDTPSPSEFMRKLRPENYSDTTERTTFVIEGPVLDHHLDTITSRNQTQDFEIFCRKLCERAICPNLRPQTGPDGGGDSKADSETLPIADELATLTYVGDANAGSEKWAFAFSAMKRWAVKARKDVEGIAGTKRGYKRVFFVTNQYAKSKTRAKLEQDLSAKFGIEVTILDRAWIMKEVLENDRGDLAFNYLHVGQEVTSTSRLGPADYSKTLQLEELEKGLSDPSRFTGMRLQEVTEALLAAKYSRSLERPRVETDGRFARAIRLAEAHGTYRQKLETRYEALWTAVWWFDDVDLVMSEYAAFEALVIDDNNARNLEFLSNLLQMLFNAVANQGYTPEQCDLEARSARLQARLGVVSGDLSRPNNALEAKTLLILGRLNLAVVHRDPEGIARTWPELSQVLATASTLGEYDAKKLIKLIDAVSRVGEDDPAYGALVEEVAAFVTERTGSAEGARILLKRAQQLDFENHVDRIRLLGRAARQLTKKEYAPELISALQLLAVAYARAGLFWAARASCIFAAASIVVDSEDGEMNVGLVPTLTILTGITLELRHLPDTLQAIQLLNGCLAGMPLSEESKATLSERLTEFDLTLGSNFLSLHPEDLSRLTDLPDILERLGMHMARSSLLYALGHEEVLRADGSIPEDETDEGVSTMFSTLASQPVSDDMRGPLITNEGGEQSLQTTVLGVEVEVSFTGTTTSILVAEAALAAIEACFATAFDLRIHPHTERYHITLVEDEAVSAPAFEPDLTNQTARLVWPKGLSPASYVQGADTVGILIDIALITMMSTCVVPDADQTMDRLAKDEGVLDRIAMIQVTATSYNRLFADDIARLTDWANLVETSYPLLEARPTIARIDLRSLVEGSGDQPELDPEDFRKNPNHRDLQVHSVIDYNLWNGAGWTGTAYLTGGGQTPGVALMFTDADAAKNIFRRWLERFGEVDSEESIYLSIIRDISPTEPTHYTVMISSRQGADKTPTRSGAMVLARHMRMHPETDANLTRFLSAYEAAGEYLLQPAIPENGQPKLLPELGVLKRALTVISAKDVGPTDIEHMVVSSKAEQNPKAGDEA